MLNNHKCEWDDGNTYCECYPRDKNGKPIPNSWYKGPGHVFYSGWAGKFARCILTSTTDYVYKEHPEVICNGCNKDMRPENCYLVEYSDDEKEWEVYDVYCFDCTEKYKMYVCRVWQKERSHTY